MSRNAGRIFACSVAMAVMPDSRVEPQELKGIAASEGGKHGQDC